MALNHNPTLATQRKAYLQVGIIVSQVNRVEMEINRLIAAYYAEVGKVKSLGEDILEDNRMSLSLKLEIFAKVATKLDANYANTMVKNDIQTWRKIRNIVAHGIVGNDVHGNVVVSHGGKEHPLNGKFSEFGRKQEAIVDYIRELLEKEK